MMPAEIRDFAIPKYLYRYRSLGPEDDPDGPKAKNEAKAITGKYVWSSNFEAMNDPMEGLFRLGTRFRKTPDVRSILYLNKIGIGICSFSETPLNELMWAHYSDNFRGICIEYDVRKLCDNLVGNNMLVRLSYDEELPEVGDDDDITPQLAKKILSKKNYRWLHEREWRLLSERPGAVKYEDTSCVTRVILGGRMDDDRRDWLSGKLVKKGIRVETLVVDGYQLTTEQF